VLAERAQRAREKIQYAKRLLLVNMLAIALALCCLLHVVRCFVAPAPVLHKRDVSVHVFKSSGLQNKPVSSSSALETQLLEAIAGLGGRGSSGSDGAKRKVNDLIAQLESSSGGVQDAACVSSVDGIWRLIYTSTPGTASPIQRSFVGVDSFGIYQNIELYDLQKPATVTNVVDFGPSIGRLDVKALASTPQRPLAGFTPRRGDGKIFGLNIFGVSQTAEQSTPANPRARIDFQFDVAGFDLKLLPFNIPYPVPFRLLGDEVSPALSVLLNLRYSALDTAKTDASGSSRAHHCCLTSAQANDLLLVCIHSYILFTGQRMDRHILFV
jgi:PAP_fibrillin